MTDMDSNAPDSLSETYKRQKLVVDERIGFVMS